MQSPKQQGNVLMIVVVLVALLSFSTLYMAKESLWSMNLSQMEQDFLQLDLLMEEAFIKTEHLIKNLPETLTPVDINHCSNPPCLLSTQHAHLFLEQTLEQWISPLYPISITLQLSLEGIEAWVIVEHLSTAFFKQEVHQYFRTTFLLLQKSPQSQLRMQATWKKATLKGNIYRDSVARLGLR